MKATNTVRQNQTRPHWMAGATVLASIAALLPMTVASAASAATATPTQKKAVEWLEPEWGTSAYDACPAAHAPVKFTKPRNVMVSHPTWNPPTVSRMRVEAGKTMCRPLPVHETAKGLIASDGALVALPKSFPKHPTVADIQGLGLTWQSPVSPLLRIPKPTRPTAPALLADTITPVRAWQEIREVQNGYDYQTNRPIMETRPVTYVEWEIRGGSGVIEGVQGGLVSPKSLLPQGSSVPLNPTGATRVVSIINPEFKADISSPEWFFASGVAPDYGQWTLPLSTMKDWDQSAKYAKDASGEGNPVGVHSNPGYPNFGGFIDGTVQLRPDLTIVGPHA